MKSFKDFMEDGAGAVGSGAAGLQSSGGSPAITSTKGVAGAGDDSSTVPVSKKKQYSMTKFNKREYKRTVPTVPLRARAGRVKEVKEEEVKSPRRITSTIKVGEKTAPAETFMTKEETVKSQKDIVAANSKTSENPTGAIPKRKKLFSDVRSGG